MKKIIAFAAAAIIGFSAYGWDFGGSLYNNSSAKNIQGESDLKAEQQNELSLWISVPFDNESSSKILGSVKYQFDKDWGINENNTTNYADLDTLYFQQTHDDTVLRAGRYRISDLTGIILSQSIDGGGVDYDGDIYKLFVNAGYTGLLNRHFNSILDGNGIAYIEDTDKIYEAAEKYGLINARITLPFVFMEQTVDVENTFVTLLDDTDFLRDYFTASLSGALARNIYYNLSSTVGYFKYGSDKNSSEDRDSEFSNLTRLNVTYFGNFKNCALSLDGVYASGEQGSLKGFKGFSSQTAVNWNRSGSEYHSLAKFGLTASMKPADNMLAMAGANAVFDAKEDVEYAGFEYSASFNWQILSDVSFGADVTQYFDSDNTDFDKTKISLKATISF